MDQIQADVCYCAAYLNNILISGRTEEEHLTTLEQVLSHLHDAGLKCKCDKCSFKDEVKYLGHIISAEGKCPDPGKTAAIMKMPAPTNADEVSSFLGKINFYSRFLSDYTDLCAPLYELKQKGKKFAWSKLCQNKFDQLKSALAKANCLAHHDPKLPLLLATDTSSYGIGAVLLHCYSDGMEKPIAFASKTLEPAEKNYSQIEKEGLSIIFGLKKFEQFLIGWHFKLTTDYCPLQILEWIRNGWPNKALRDSTLLPFYCHKDVLHEQDGVILYFNQQVVIPPPLQSLTLRKLHYTHAGTVKMKQAAHTYVWWPGIDQNIEAL
uniref:RNA-directed DNA polymerase n=1 Tax=Plectus sambesii TaxID=2011161 RepID=A0A914UMG5_9BILA